MLNKTASYWSMLLTLLWIVAHLRLRKTIFRELLPALCAQTAWFQFIFCLWVWFKNFLTSISTLPYCIQATYFLIFQVQYFSLSCTKYSYSSQDPCELHKFPNCFTIRHNIPYYSVLCRYCQNGYFVVRW